MKHVFSMLLVLGLVTPCCAQPNTLPELVEWAKKELPRIQAVKGYMAVFTAIEQINGNSKTSIALVKVRHEPFAVYMLYLSPPLERGREVMYREDAGSRFWVKEPRLRTVFLSINSPLVKKHTRYPITDFGVANLAKKLIEVGEKEQYTPGLSVKRTRVSVEGAVCNKYTIERQNLKVVLYVDEERSLPVRYDCWQDGVLMESYRYSKIKFTTFSDKDFDTRNQEYHFRR